MEKIETYKNKEIKVLLIFNAAEHFVRDKNNRNKLLSTVSYNYFYEVLINGNFVLQNSGQVFYDEYTETIAVETYKEMVLNSGISLGKEIIDKKL